MIERIKWYIKQLFPLDYYTTYGSEGKRFACHWKMWFGKCYNVRTFEIVQ